MSGLMTFLCSVLGATGAALIGIWVAKKWQEWQESRQNG